MEKMDLDQKPVGFLEKNKFLKNKKSAFSLIEVLLVILIISGLTGYYIKNFSKLKRKKTVYSVMHEINDFCKKTLCNALLNKKIYEVKFLFNDDNSLNMITSSPKKESNDSKDKIKFDELKFIDEKLIFKSLIINKKNEFAAKTTEAWFLIYPEGYSQEVETSFQIENISIDILLNPFTCSFQEK